MYNICVMFKVRHTEETLNRTLRFPKLLLKKISFIAQKENVSFNNFVIQCCEYTISHMDEAEYKK